MHVNQRNAPNILITGTPAVGKSTLCKRISSTTGFRWLEISNVAKENGCVEKLGEEYQFAVLDEDKLLDGLEDVMASGGNIVDHHSCELFPERWFDVVFVLRTNNTTLYDRLTERGHTGKKLKDNVECEIFKISLEEARSSYRENIVHELTSTTQEELETNFQSILMWLQQWFQNKQTS